MEFLYLELQANLKKDSKVETKTISAKESFSLQMKFFPLINLSKKESSSIVSTIFFSKTLISIIWIP